MKTPIEDIREWKRFFIPYEQAVEELKIKFRSIRNGYREVSEYSPIEFVTGRVKKLSSIIEKAKRYDIALKDVENLMEDIAGIRIMCQLLDDIYTVVDLVRERNGSDFEIVYEKDYIHDFKQSGYRSYHIVIRYPVHTAFGLKTILAEIQIRTLAMNFWATIEHSLNYKYRENIPEDVKRRLQNAADAVWSLDNEMLQIKDQIMDSQVLFEYNSNIVRSISERIQILRLANGTRADEFDERLSEILESGRYDELDSLLEEVTECLEK
ncbi:GTP pyrophosphokinase [Guggenheimella bovis]